jgi:hypothetical protein
MSLYEFQVRINDFDTKLENKHRMGDNIFKEKALSKATRLIKLAEDQLSNGQLDDAIWNRLIAKEISDLARD